jgi:hypothetical protein
MLDGSIFIAYALVGGGFDVQKAVVDGKVVEPGFVKGSGTIS